MKVKLLPKNIILKMNAREMKTYKKLMKEFVETGKAMEKAQEEASMYVRKTKNPTTLQQKRAKKLINVAFRVEYFAFKKADEWDAFKTKMKKKYRL